MVLEQCAFCGREFNCSQDDISSGKTGEPVCPDPQCQADQVAVTVVIPDD